MSVPPTGALIVGKYRLGRLLGQGGFGSVYEGENVDIGKKVAIKLIDRRKKRSTEAIARFRREARLAGKIESPHIVQIFDVGDDESLGLFMVMELLRGDDLRQKLDRVGKLPVEAALEFAHQIACGLAKAHAASVLHRDLKPANVFLHQLDGDSATLVKIVDFGIAKLLGDPGDARDARDAQPLTSFGQTMGTPQYMAPEQVQGFSFDHRVDLWALGAVLYEMLAGKPAYALHPTFQETAVAIVTKSPVPLGELAPWVPAQVAEVIEHALRRDPNDRIPDAATFAEMIAASLPSAFADGRGFARVAALPRGGASLRPSGPSLPPGQSFPPSSRPSFAPGSGPLSSPVSAPASKPKARLLLVEEPEPSTGHSSRNRAREDERSGAHSAEHSNLVPSPSRRWIGIVLVIAVLLAGGAILGAAAMRVRDRPPAPSTPRSVTTPTVGKATGTSAIGTNPVGNEAASSLTANSEAASSEAANGEGAAPSASLDRSTLGVAPAPKLPSPASPKAPRKTFGSTGLSKQY